MGIYHMINISTGIHVSSWWISLHKHVNNHDEFTYTIQLPYPLPCSVPKLKNAMEPTRTALSWNPSSKRASGWLVDFFFILVLNMWTRGPVKKHPVFAGTHASCPTTSSTFTFSLSARPFSVSTSSATSTTWSSTSSLPSISSPSSSPLHLLPLQPLQPGQYHHHCHQYHHYHNLFCIYILYNLYNLVINIIVIIIAINTAAIITLIIIRRIRSSSRFG